MSRALHEADLFPPDVPEQFDEDYNGNPTYEHWMAAWFAPYFEPVGPANRAALRSIADRLRRALPVRQFRSSEDIGIETENYPG